MDDIVALRVVDSKRRKHYFLTWGRILDAVDPASLEALVKGQASKFGIKKAVWVQLCGSVGEAAQAQFFYEAIFHFTQTRIPFGVRTYKPWRAKIRKEMMRGRHIFYCGKPT